MCSAIYAHSKYSRERKDRYYLTMLDHSWKKLAPKYSSPGLSASFLGIPAVMDGGKIFGGIEKVKNTEYFKDTVD